MQFIYSNYHVDLHKTSDLDLTQKKSVFLAIQAWFPNDLLLPSYLEKRLTLYPYILVSKKTRLIGVFFIDFFKTNDELFLYIGPIFSRNFFAYSATFMRIFHHYCERYKTVHLLTEAQNPTIAMHWHLLFPKETTYSAFNHHKPSNAQWQYIKLYQEHISHFTCFNSRLFKTTSKESLFKDSKSHQILVNYLEKRSIFLMNGDSMVLYTSFKSSDLPKMSSHIHTWVQNKTSLKKQFIQTLLESS